MKCTNRVGIILAIGLSTTFILTGCNNNNLACQYNQLEHVQSGTFNEQMAEPFANDLCISSKNVTEGTDVKIETEAAAGLFDINQKKVLYAKDIHERMNPASLTKMMTALVALKYGSTDDMITCSENVKIKEMGATTCGLKEGDKLTLNQALHALIIHSANDAGIAIAEHIGGSVEGFSEMMNQEAIQIGATNSHFSNPHGLTETEHYTTVYDMYLIMNAVMQYDNFNEIIQMTEYSTVYSDRDGKEKNMEFKSTNLFLRGQYSAPDKITVIGGKTGTTAAAGSCLALLTKDTSGNPYIAIILKASQRDYLYEEMIDLLEEIHN